MKKAVNISLDNEILKQIDKLRKEGFEAKRSSVINEILKEYFKNGGKFKK